jgi:hypothetical protein
MADERDPEFGADCDMCGSPVRTPVENVGTKSKPRYHRMIRECTNPECEMHEV